MNSASEVDDRSLPDASKEVSSSDYEVTAGHWSLSPEKHCLLSADQLQLELWRDDLKQEIEEDLQRQVRDRLGLDRPPIASCIQSSIDMYNSSHLYSHSRQVSQNCHQSPQVKIANELCPGKQSSEVSDDKNNNDWEQTKAVSSYHVSKQPSKTYLVKSNPSDNQPPADGSQPTRRERQQTLSEYVNFKYGVPSDQLLHLSSTGAFQTRVVDSGGLGGGPFIHVPVEANIIFPTPSHVSPCSPLTSLSSPNDDDNVKSTSQCVSSATNHQQLVDGSIWDQTNSFMPVHHSTKVFTQKTPIVFRTKRIVFNGGAEDVTTSHNGLQFEARFEGGNLQQAVQVGTYEYRLSLNSDLYSTKHTQWFYFRIEGMVSMAMYTFHIINFYKPDSLYNYGMQPLLYSSHSARLTGVGWSRVGTNVHYYSQSSLSAKKYYTLTWEMLFPHTEDVCYLAYCYPYPYTKLVNLLDTIEKCPYRSKYVRRESLCKSLSGNDCPLLTITDYDALPHTIQSRSGIVVSARVHPGETNSSWMMEGLLGMLTADTPHAKALRSHFVFKVMPMLNPDGVIVGNYRTSLAGVDLNRVYKNTVPELFPTIFHTKAVVDSFMMERKVTLYLDLHGHSRKHNVFMYGCHTSQCDSTQFLNARIFPFLVSQQVPQMFSYDSCKFSVHRSKEATGRVVMWRRGVPHSFTMEATFCGSTLGHNPQFTAEDFMEMGRSLGEAIYKFHRAKTSNSYEQKVLGQLADIIMQSAKKSSANLPDLVTTHNHTSYIHGESSDTVPTKKGKSYRKSLRRFMKFDISQVQESSTSGSDSENDSFDFKKKKSRPKNSKRCSSLHTRTQPVLHSQPGHTEHHSQQSREHRPQLLGAGRISSYSQVPLPPLTRFSAPPRLQGGRERRTALGWKFINKYKGRSNGGIPIFSEERMKERAEKQRLHSITAFPTSASDIKEALSQGNENQKTKAKVSTTFLWQPDNADLPITKDDESSTGIKSLVARQQFLRGHEPSMLNTKRVHRGQEGYEKRLGRRHDHKSSLRHYNHGRHLAASQAMGDHTSSGCGQTRLPPVLAKYIRELWSKAE